MTRIEPGDCLTVIPRLVAEGVLVDAIVCDPPYGLEFMGKEWDGADGFRRSLNAADAGRDNVFGRTSPAWKAIGKRRNPENEGQADDVTSTGARQHLHIYQEWTEAWAREAMAILKPGGYLLAFGGTRTYHRMTCAIEDAGFEIRDAIMWHYGTGFPKSLNVSKAIDKAAGAEREVVATVRVKGGGTEHINRSNAAVHDYRPDGYQKGDNILDVTTAGTPEAAAWEGWGTALKPATEIICVARKPLSERTVAANVLKHGAGALNIDECRIEGEAGAGVWGSSNETIALVEAGRRTFNASPDQRDYRSRPYRAALRNVRNEESDENRKAYSKGLAGSRAAGTTTVGRWPANLAHDGSPEVMALFPDSDSARVGNPNNPTHGQNTSNTSWEFGPLKETNDYRDTGSAARFFYSTKAGAEDRWGSKHPTVKPVKLIEWLITLVTRRGGLVLDCFAGSGTAGVAALATGRDAILIERDPNYIEDIRARVGFYEGGGRHSVAAKARNAAEKPGSLL